MATGYEIIAVDEDGNQTIDPYVYREQVDAKGDVLELGRANPHLSYLVSPRDFDEERLHDKPRFHDVRRYRRGR